MEDEEHSVLPRVQQISYLPLFLHFSTFKVLSGSPVTDRSGVDAKPISSFSLTILEVIIRILREYWCLTGGCCVAALASTDKRARMRNENFT